MERTIYRLGAELLSVRQFMEKQPEQAVLYHALQAMTSAVEVTGLRTHPPADDDDRFIAEIALGLLCRGWPTLSSPFVEETLLQNHAPELGLTFEAGPAHEVTWRLSTDDEEPAASLVKSIANALLPTDDGLLPRPNTTIWRQDSVAEMDFFQQEMAHTLGPLRACAEWQRPLETMAGSPKLKSQTVNQRADFTLELGPTGVSREGVRLNLEIDGPDHHSPAQRRKDDERDAILHQAGWNFHRIPIETLTTGWELPIRGEQISPLAQHPVYCARYDAPLTEELDKIGLTARAILLTPHAITRVQLAILLALREGVLSLNQPKWQLLVWEREVSCARLALADLSQLLTQLCMLYGVDSSFELDLTVVGELNGHSGQEDLHLLLPEARRISVASARTDEFDLAIDVSVLCRSTQQYLDERLDGSWLRLRTAPSSASIAVLTWASPRAIPNPLEHKAALTYFLQFCFRKRSFRDGQLPIIERAMRRQSVIGLLPTGAGKSLTYQLPALLSPGHAFIVDPIKSLMQDQVDNLREVGIDSAVTINSDLLPTAREIAELSMAEGDFRFVFISPERLQIEKFRTHLAKLCTRTPISFAVIDEAHCVSEWGHDFRPAYLNLGRNARKFFKHGQLAPPIIALTGTASRQVLIDVRREIDVEDEKAIIEPKSHSRPELHYEIVTSNSQDKRRNLLALFDSLPERLADVGCTGSLEELQSGLHGGIVFCSFVGSPFGVENVESILKPTDWGARTGIYCGRIPPGRGQLKTSEWNDHKSRTQSEFKQNKLSVLVATNAFGMGIDKSNIRYTVHYGTPKSLEALAQEAGRAGRDGANSLCTVLFSTHLPRGVADPLEEDIPTEEAKRRLDKVRRNERDDALRSMYLHFLSYPGVDAEATDINRFFQVRLADRLSSKSARGTIREFSKSTKSLLRSLVDPSERRGSGRNEGVADSDDDTGSVPVVDLGKIVHRLSLLGIVHDYTVEYYSDEERTYSLELDSLSLDETTLLSNLRAYVERYDRVHAWPLVESDYLGTDGEPVNRAIWALTKFMYRAVEVRRREAMRNVREVLSNAKDGTDLKRAIDDYFSTTTFGPHLAKVAGASSTTQAVHNVVENVTSFDAARQLLGQTLRALESDPNNPGLRVISGLARASVETPDPIDVAMHLMGGFNAEFEQTHAIPTELISGTLSALASLAPQLVDDVVVETLNLESRASPEIADYIAVASLPLVSSPRSRKACASRIADQLAWASEASPALGKAGSIAILASLESGNNGSSDLKDLQIGEVLSAFRWNSPARPSRSLAFRIFAECAFRAVRDPGVKQALAAPIFHDLRRNMQQIV